jgi:hypothetical protein
MHRPHGRHLKLDCFIFRSAFEIDVESSAAGIFTNAQIGGPALVRPGAIPELQDVRLMDRIIEQDRHIPHQVSTS